MEHWEYLKPDGLRFVWDDGLFRPGTDLSAVLPAEALPGLRVCDLGCGTGLLGPLLPAKAVGTDRHRDRHSTGGCGAGRAGPPPKTA